MTGQPGTCAHCGQPGIIMARGWIRACYFRWWRAGKPADGPPDRKLRGEERRAEYAHLLAAGESRHGAAERLGLHPNTVRRYEAALKAQAAGNERCGS